MERRKLFFLHLFLLLIIAAAAQSTAGLTGVSDTSFSLHREHQKLVKQYPFIRPVHSTPLSSVVEKKGIVYCSLPKRKLALDVFYPTKNEAKGRAAIMLIYGGGWRSGDRSQLHALAQRLAEQGFVCFTPDYRLSTEALYPAAVYDLKAALHWIRANAHTYKIDTSKIAVGGFSAGGQLAALLGTTVGLPEFENRSCPLKSSGAIHAIINLDGTLAFIHPESGEGDDSKKTSAATYWFGFTKTENPALWRQASPLTHVGPKTPPTLFLNSSVARMHAGRDDFQKILDAYGIHHVTKTFEGAPHSFPLFQPWLDSTVIQIDGFLKKLFEKKAVGAQTFIVAKDGSGQFQSVQAAFDAVPLNNQTPVTIYVRNGVYREKLFLDSTKRFVTLIGEDKFKTVLTYDDHTGKLSPNGDTINTYTSHSFLLAASDFAATNISFENTAGFSAGQAVAVQILGDRVKFTDCRFIGNQDVLFPSRSGTRQYFSRCYIEGTTDFIFGPSTAWFDACHIHSKKNSHITAASTTREARFGYVFSDCVLTGDTTLRNVSMGRPWRPYAHVVMIRSYLGPHIKAEGWAAWNNTSNHLATTFAEYANYGPSANSVNRLGWVKRLSDEEVKKYTLVNVLDDWNPLNDHR